MALSFHKVREAIAARIVRFDFINSEDNPADVVSKHWGYQQVGSLIQYLLFLPSGNNKLSLIKKDTPIGSSIVHEGSDKFSVKSDE